jgi:lipoprotein-anchoring transpeptidase ErfK/SrfK
MGKRTTFRRAPALTLLLAGVGWLTVAMVGAPLAHAQPMGNSAVEAARAAETARQTGGRTAAPAPAPAPAPAAPAPSASPAIQPAQPSQPAPAITGTYDVGATGDNVKVIEQRLDALHYFVGSIDTTYDQDTFQAVMAFQKTNGLDRTGKVDQAVWIAIQGAKDPQPLVASGGEHRVEIDLNRQVLFLYEGAKLTKILPVSTGSGNAYCENGSCGDAVTPTGDFKIYRQGEGWESGPLGDLYNPQYFTGGIAIHGAKSVPAQPASHGCVRIPMGAADWFPSHVSLGTPVFVR